MATGLAVGPALVDSLPPRAGTWVGESKNDGLSACCCRGEHFQSLTRPRHPTARRDSDEGPIAGLGQVAAFYSKLMGHSAVWTAETHHLLLNQREGSQIGCHSGIDRAACSWASKRETAHEHLQRIVLGLIRRPRDLFMWIVKRRHASRAATRPVRCESSRLSQRV